jgi:hypothetical protein
MDHGFNIELGYGITNQEITNPDSSKAVYEGYGGHAAVYYPLFQNENFSFGPNGKYFYSELKNKANTANLSEEMRYYGIAPGLEFKVYSFFMGYNFKYQWLSVDMSGAFENKVTSRFSSPEFYIGVEVPLANWALRAYYLRSQSDIPRQDTGLSVDSPWAEESLYIGVRYRFGKTRSSNSGYIRPDAESSEIIAPRLPRRSFRTTPSGASYLND